MENLRVTNTVEIPELELTWRFSRSSGPGGQHVNTSDSRVELRFDVANSGAFTPAQREQVLEQLESRLVDGVVTVAASRFRSQYRNRQDALERLSALLAGALAPPAPPRRATKPSRRARQRRVDEKRQRGELKKLRRNPDQ